MEAHHYLSFPPGFSVNDGIDPSLCSMVYTTVDEVVAQASQVGKVALLAKIDIESAYRLIPVHPQDCHLQAMRWEGRVYVDPMLPFGLSSAPKFFNAVADALCWHLHQSGIPIIRHYLDDYVIISHPNSSQCQESLDILDRECDALGVPTAAHKRDGPTTCLVFLDIIIDTGLGEIRLPADKLTRLKILLEEWGDRKACTRRVGVANQSPKPCLQGG